MRKIGAHVSIKKGLKSLKDIYKELDADCCQIFTKGPMRFASSKIPSKDREDFKNSKLPVVVHGNYLTNLANIKEKTLENFYDDIDASEQLGAQYFLFHPGSDVQKKGEKKALKEIANEINKALNKFKTINILVENMAGTGTVLPHKFEQLNFLLKNIEQQDRIGVCLDTCHLFAAGYDIRTKEEYEKTMKSFDEIVGLEKIKVFHLNDSKNELMSKKDRHELLGKGKIGIDAFKFLMEDERFDDRIFILETPDETKYKEEIALLRSFIKE